MGFRTWFYKTTGIKLKKNLDKINTKPFLHESSVIGQYTYLNSNAQVNSYVNIGKYCSISCDVIIAPDDHPINWLSTHPFQCDPEWSNLVGVNGLHFIAPNNHTIIMNDVWIGTRAIIKRGVTIGNGAIIGAGSVVTKDVPDYAIFAGNPAKLIRYRFSKDIIDKLLKLEWWNMPAEKLKDVIFNDIEKAIAQLSAVETDIK